MKNRVTIDLARDVPVRTADVLCRVPSVTVREGQPESRLRINGASIPLVVLSGLRPYAHVTANLLASLVGKERLGLVVGDRIARHVRRELEAAGCAYADATGAVHIDVPGLMLHVEPTQPRSTRRIAPSGVGVVGVRLIQVMLGDPQRDWSVEHLAAAAACSTGQAHNTAVKLESEGLLTVTGRGPARRRKIINPGDLLDWLANVPAARRLRERLPAYLYTPDPAGPVTLISASASDSKLEYAVTGTAGAAAFGALVTTATPYVTVRIDPDVELRAAAKALRAEPVDSGANLVLVRDLGRLGVHGKAQIGPVAVASPVRIWLDMLGEPRGEDAAALFREAVLGW
ncbi:MAG TPA: hypothetical protein VMV07_27445 [Streptosporangiaceae bacterium]|nr:hypothetical protein [Streptosporangiaceae bacterium]